MGASAPTWLFFLQPAVVATERYKLMQTPYESNGVYMYLDVYTMIAIMIALLASIFTVGYCIYIIKTQNEIIQRMSSAASTRRKMQR